MLGALANRIFGSSNDRRIKAYRRRVAAISMLESEMASLSDEALRGRTAEFRDKLSGGKALDDLLVPAFATVREGARRALGQRHFDVQMIGGMVLNDGAIAEMRTGEGKTLVGTLAVYLNALAGKGVHVVTVNDYLAARDAATMARLYGFLGLTVGVVAQGMDDDARRAAYACDITYGTNSEFGFDYLRDNMKFTVAEQVQRGHHYAVVDEVDSILIDEARTPLVVSGLSEDRSALYAAVDGLVRKLGRGHYDIDERHRSASLNEGGLEVIEGLLTQAGILREGGLHDSSNADALHHVHQALRAHALFRRDKDYVVRSGEVVIVDESTGRTMQGRRYADGLHQAIEAKEGVAVQPETVTLASVTYQNLFRMYGKLCGMTGTAGTEVEEFREIYALDVIEIPTNLPVARVDEHDEVYRTAAEKYPAVVAAVGRAHDRGQPVLVGTSSVEQSEVLAALMEKAGYVQADFSDAESMREFYAAAREGRPSRRFAVLNARVHDQEAYIVAEAGVPGAITIATNMAGRGTDIKLGGSVEMRVARELGDDADPAVRAAAVAAVEAEVKANRERVLASGEKADPASGRPADLPGGLFVIGSERHESRRIDNQLRGRSGRQGDPGRSRFYLSVEDDLVRIFGSDRIGQMLDEMGVGTGEAIVHPIINKVVAKAQSKVESQNFNQRKDVLKYDDVANAQRKAVFAQRREIMALPAEGIREIVDEMRMGALDDILARHVDPRTLPDDWDIDALKAASEDILCFSADYEVWSGEDGVDHDVMRERLLGLADRFYAQVTEANGPDVTARAERQILLQVLDAAWRGHIETLDHLRQGIGLRGIGQRDPVQEFNAEAYELFEALAGKVRRDVTANLHRVRIAPSQAQAA